MRDLSKETDVTLLQQAVRLLEHENNRLANEVAALMRELARLQNSSNPELDVQAKLEAVEQHLAKLQKALFGPKSERTQKPEEPKGSEDSGESAAASGEEPAPSSENPPRRPRRSKPRRAQSSLPRLPFPHSVPEGEKQCELCGEPLEDWEGHDETSLEVHVLRRAFVMVEHHQKKARCRNGCSIKTAPAPRKLFPGARYSIGFTLQVAIDKYLEHLPLSRQVRQMAYAGLAMDTQTLWDQLNKLAAVLSPLYLRILEYIFQHSVVGADETTWRMMSEKERIKHGKNRSWYVWTLATHDAVYYEIHDGRSLAAARSLLGGYAGVILCDGYKVYESLAGSETDVVLAFCWAHVRRKFKDIEQFFPSDAKRIIGLINDLFELEDQSLGNDAAALAQRAVQRNLFSRPIVAEIKTWAEKVKTLPGNGLDDAIRYMTNHWTGLTRFLDDPCIPLSNNIAERANRDPVLGRKNHYGSRSVRGTEVAAQLYTILETAKLNGVDANAYLELAVEAALDGAIIPMPHECTGAVAERAELNIRKASQFRDIQALLTQT